MDGHIDVKLAKLHAVSHQKMVKVAIGNDYLRNNLEISH